MSEHFLNELARVLEHAPQPQRPADDAERAALKRRNREE